MPLSLHVFPPAFALPSIDAECLAAIAYLSRALPRNAWTLVAEPGLSEGEDELPCLRDGATVVVGFDAIVEHLRNISNGQWDLDAHLNKQQKADCLAFSSHLTQNLSPLVDLSLYICAENYDFTTRRAYGATLSFPESWAVPPKRQALARTRTSHLGLAPADLSPPTSAASSPEVGPTRAFDDPFKRAQRPATAPRAGITSTAAAAQRLNAVIEAALAPVASLHASSTSNASDSSDSSNTSDMPHGRFLLSDQVTTLDCHALALLALALMPCLENPFLALAFGTRFKGLEGYTRGMVGEVFGPPVTASDALVRAPMMGSGEEEEGEEEGLDFDEYGNVEVGSGRMELPWRRAKKRSLGTVVKGMARMVAA